MNRTIKFRGFYEQHWMVYWDLLFINDESDSGSSSLNTTIKEVQKGCELMQFTGLLDKNGKEIYESDIVKFSDTWYWIVNGEIKFDRCWFCIFYKAELSDIFLSLSSYEVEVIWNLYENPELLN